MDNTQRLQSDDEEEEEAPVDKNRAVGNLHMFAGVHGPVQDFPIYPGQNVIGRHHSCDITLPAQSVSKKHAVIDVTGECHTICDNNSLNKTRRSKVALAPHVRYALSEGDFLLFADVACLYTIVRRVEAETSAVEESEDDSMLVPGTQAALAIEKTPAAAIRRMGRATVLAMDSGDEDDGTRIQRSWKDGGEGGSRDAQRTSETGDLSSHITDTVVPESDEEVDMSPSETHLPSLPLRGDNDTDTHETSRRSSFVPSSQSIVAPPAVKEPANHPSGRSSPVNQEETSIKRQDNEDTKEKGASDVEKDIKDATDASVVDSKPCGSGDGQDIVDAGMKDEGNHVLLNKANLKNLGDNVEQSSDSDGRSSSPILKEESSGDTVLTGSNEMDPGDYATVEEDNIKAVEELLKGKGEVDFCLNSDTDDDESPIKSKPDQKKEDMAETKSEGEPGQSEKITSGEKPVQGSADAEVLLDEEKTSGEKAEQSGTNAEVLDEKKTLVEEPGQRATKADVLVDKKKTLVEEPGQSATNADVLVDEKKTLVEEPEQSSTNADVLVDEKKSSGEEPGQSGTNAGAAVQGKVGEINIDSDTDGEDEMETTETGNLEIKTDDTSRDDSNMDNMQLSKVTTDQNIDHDTDVEDEMEATGTVNLEIKTDGASRDDADVDRISKITSGGNTDNDTHVEDAEMTRSDLGNAELDVSKSIQEKKEEFHMDSDTDAEDDGVSRSDNVDSKTSDSPAKDSKDAFHLDISSTDISKDEQDLSADVKEVKVDFHVDSDTDVEEDDQAPGSTGTRIDNQLKSETSNCGKNETDVANKKAAELILDSDTDVDEEDDISAGPGATEKAEGPGGSADLGATNKVADLHVDSDTDVDEEDGSKELDETQAPEVDLYIDDVSTKEDEIEKPSASSGTETSKEAVEEETTKTDSEGSDYELMATQCYLEPQEPESDLPEEEEATQAYILSSTWAEPDPFKRPYDPIGVLQISAVSLDKSEEDVDENAVAETQLFCLDANQSVGPTVQETPQLGNETADSAEVPGPSSAVLESGEEVGASPQRAIVEEDTQPVSQITSARPSEEPGTWLRLKREVPASVWVKSLNQEGESSDVTEDDTQVDESTEDEQEVPRLELEATQSFILENPAIKEQEAQDTSSLSPVKEDGTGHVVSAVSAAEGPSPKPSSMDTQATDVSAQACSPNLVSDSNASQQAIQVPDDDNDATQADCPILPVTDRDVSQQGLQLPATDDGTQAGGPSLLVSDANVPQAMQVPDDDATQANSPSLPVIDDVPRQGMQVPDDATQANSPSLPVTDDVPRQGLQVPVTDDATHAGSPSIVVSDASDVQQAMQEPDDDGTQADSPSLLVPNTNALQQDQQLPSIDDARQASSLKIPESDIDELQQKAKVQSTDDATPANNGGSPVLAASAPAQDLKVSSTDEATQSCSLNVEDTEEDNTQLGSVPVPATEKEEKKVADKEKLPPRRGLSRSRKKEQPTRSAKPPDESAEFPEETPQVAEIPHESDAGDSEQLGTGLVVSEAKEDLEPDKAERRRGGWGKAAEEDEDKTSSKEELVGLVSSRKRTSKMALEAEPSVLGIKEKVRRKPPDRKSIANVAEEETKNNECERDDIPEKPDEIESQLKSVPTRSSRRTNNMASEDEPTASGVKENVGRKPLNRKSIAKVTGDEKKDESKEEPSSSLKSLSDKSTRKVKSLKSDGKDENIVEPSLAEVSVGRVNKSSEKDNILSVELSEIVTSKSKTETEESQIPESACAPESKKPVRGKRRVAAILKHNNIEDQTSDIQSEKQGDDEIPLATKSDSQDGNQEKGLIKRTRRTLNVQSAESSMHEREEETTSQKEEVSSAKSQRLCRSMKEEGKEDSQSTRLPSRRGRSTKDDQKDDQETLEKSSTSGTPSKRSRKLSKEEKGNSEQDVTKAGKAEKEETDSQSKNTQVMDEDDGNSEDPGTTKAQTGRRARRGGNKQEIGDHKETIKETVTTRTRRNSKAEESTQEDQSNRSVRARNRSKEEVEAEDTKKEDTAGQKASRKTRRNVKEDVVSEHVAELKPTEETLKAGRTPSKTRRNMKETEESEHVTDPNQADEASQAKRTPSKTRKNAKEKEEMGSNRVTEPAKESLRDEESASKTRRKVKKSEELESDTFIEPKPTEEPSQSGRSSRARQKVKDNEEKQSDTFTEPKPIEESPQSERSFSKTRRKVKEIEELESVADSKPSEESAQSERSFRTMRKHKESVTEPKPAEESLQSERSSRTMRKHKESVTEPKPAEESESQSEKSSSRARRKGKKNEELESIADPKPSEESSQSERSSSRTRSKASSEDVEKIPPKSGKKEKLVEGTKENEETGIGRRRSSNKEELPQVSTPVASRKRGPASKADVNVKRKKSDETIEQEAERVIPASRRGRKLTTPDDSQAETADRKEIPTPEPSPSRRPSSALGNPADVRTPRRANRASTATLTTSPYVTPSAAMPKVLFTGVVDAVGEEIIRSLGGDIADSVFDCTHLITDRVRRTVKFLCALARGIPIITLDWIDKCKKSGCFLSPAKFLVNDKEQEKNFNFVLSESLQKAKRKTLLEGYEIHVTPSVKPEPEHMRDIIRCSGATFLPKMPRTFKEKVVIVSCPEDAARCKSAPSKIPVTTAEFILSGILRQEVNPAAYLLNPAGEDVVPTPAKRRR